MHYLIIAVTWFDLFALFITNGVLAVWIWILPNEEIIQSSGVLRLLWQALGVVLLILTFCSIIILFNQAAVMSNQSYSDELPFLPDVIIRTHFGNLWILRIVGLTIGWITWIHWRHSTRSSAGWFVLIAALFLMIVSHSATITDDYVS